MAWFWSSKKENWWDKYKSAAYLTEEDKLFLSKCTEEQFIDIIPYGIKVTVPFLTVKDCVPIVKEILKEKE